MLINAARRCGDPGSGMSLRFNLFICHLSVLAYLADCMTIQ